MNHRNEYKKFDREARWTGKKIAITLFILAVLFGGASYIFGWFSETAQVAKDEFGPKASLEKYEWFISQSNNIQKMDQDIKLVTERIASLDAQHTQSYGINKSKWPIDVRMQVTKEENTLNDQLVATKAQRNKLASEYNAQSEKFNWDLYRTDSKKPSEKIMALE